MKIMTLLITALISLNAFAAAEGGHGGSGGDGYMCPKAHPEEEAYPPYNLRLVDTYGDTSLDDIVQDNEGQLMDPFGMRTIARFINRKMPTASYPHPMKPGAKIPFGTLLLLRNLQIYFYHSDLTKLKDISDDNIWWWQVPRGCKKVQLAIQDIKSATVRMSEFTPNLPLIDSLFLQLHETMISLRNQPGLDTTPVRRDVEKLAEIVRTHRDDFVRGLTKDFETAMTVPESAPTLVIAKKLMCQTTWKMPALDAYQPKFEMPSRFTVERVSGAGGETDKNVYRVNNVESFKTQMLTQPTIYSSNVAQQIHAFETKFELSKGVTYTLGLYDLVDEAGVYVGDVQAEFTNSAVRSKSKQMSTHEMYDAAGVMCIAQP